MAILYIDRRGAALELDGQTLVLRCQGERLAAFPLRGTERVVIRRAEQISVNLLAALGERGIGLLVLHGRRGEAAAQLLGAPHGDVTRRIGQFLLASTSSAAFRLAGFAIRGKIIGHLRFLDEAVAAYSHPRQRNALEAARLALTECLSRLRASADLETARGIEGAAASAFWQAYAHLFAPHLGFAGRNRRPPRDPVNATLSLAYTLLFSDAVQAIAIAGLDPLLGFLHAPLAGRASLACDLVEFVRPAADRFVWQLFRERALRAEHFSRHEGACLMGKAARALFYEAYESFAPRERRRLRHLAAVYVRAAREAVRGIPQIIPDVS
jgi:CRISPR-associated protein Cas1